MSGDGRLAVSASNDKTLKVWGVESGSDLHTLEGHSGIVSVAVSGDERKAFSASFEKLKVWDVESGYELRTLEGHSTSINGVASSRDGRLAVLTLGDTLKVWDVESGASFRLEFSFGHSRLLSGGSTMADGWAKQAAEEYKQGRQKARERDAKILSDKAIKEAAGPKLWQALHKMLEDEIRTFNNEVGDGVLSFVSGLGGDAVGVERVGRPKEAVTWRYEPGTYSLFCAVRRPDKSPVDVNLLPDGFRLG